MRRLLLLGFLLATGGLFTSASEAGGGHHRHRRGCAKLFTVSMGQRAARAVYRDTRTVTVANLRLLGRIEHCQRNPQARGFMRWYDHHQAVLHDRRVYDASHPWSTDIATMYDDSGNTSSGEHFTYGFASCGSEGVGCWPFGTRVEFCYAGRCIVGQRQDSGPYGPAAFDLNNAMGYYLGLDGPGRAQVSYRVLP